MTKTEFFAEIPGTCKAIGPYSIASSYSLSNDKKLLFCSGQIGLDPSSSKLVGDDLQSQARQIFANIDTILKHVSLAKVNILKSTVFLTDMASFAEFNALYAEWLGDAKPARSTVAVAALPAGAKLEIEIIAGF